jgi:hypothetical protein
VGSAPTTHTRAPSNSPVTHSLEFAVPQAGMAPTCQPQHLLYSHPWWLPHPHPPPHASSMYSLVVPFSPFLTALFNKSQKTKSRLWGRVVHGVGSRFQQSSLGPPPCTPHLAPTLGIPQGMQPCPARLLPETPVRHQCGGTVPLILPAIHHSLE